MTSCPFQVLFRDNCYQTSPYNVKEQTTKVVLPSSTVESYTKSVKPVSFADGTITYGTYNNIAPFTKVGVMSPRDGLTVSYCVC